MLGIRFPRLAMLALVAAVARSNSVNLLNDIPVNTIMDEGTTFVLKWEWDGDASGVGQLDMSSFTLDGSGTAQNDILEDKLNLTMGRYPWVVKAAKGQRTLSWYHSLGISYNGGFNSISGRSFRIRASSTPSSTTTTSATSTSSSTSSTGSPTSTSNEPSQSPSSTSSGLNGGAIAGTVVGALAGVGILATLLSLVVYYRRKLQREDKATSDPAGVSADRKSGDAVEAHYQKPELDAAGPGRVYYELDSTQLIQEVDTPLNPSELDSNARSELDGDTAHGRRGVARTSG
ncbi:hypothetical protein E0Z10_g1163 [Xylaria hypoxylon]|uniref:Mid2 domain-containing protein n=1 Tax=Xylaria hypoxylon TaxID=37992 RepID=A0A4Z0Z7B0_9PEZI|nr:hypothetical protein E0Z10_g1163 [Xylaria hypoxylon]